MRTYPLLILLLAACAGERPADAPAAGNDSLAVTQTSPEDVAPPPPERTIRPDGIGHAFIGMTVGELRAALPPELTIGPVEAFMVDVDALPVMQGAQTLYYAMFESGTPITDTTHIVLLATTHADVRTVDGIAPGITLARAAALAGEPRLSYNTNDESREWAYFPYLQPSIMVRVGPREDGSFAGTYMTSGEYNETSEYDPDAVVLMVVVQRE